MRTALRLDRVVEAVATALSYKLKCAQNELLIMGRRSTAIIDAGNWQIAQVDDLSSSWPFGAVGRSVACQ